MDTWRLNFIDIDLSFNTPVPDSTFEGYMVVRAPKGTTVPTYFPKSNQTKIESMLGIATADWSDLQDAIDYNAQFGVWLSAPPGTGATYPSYYGGSYLTDRGVFPFYEVTASDVADINFLSTVTVGSEDSEYLHPATGSSNSSVQVVPADPTIAGALDALSISNISSTLLNAVTGLDFTYWGNPAYGLNPGATTYHLTVSGTNVYADNPDLTGPVQVGTISGNTLRLTGTTSPNSFLYINFDNLVSRVTYQTSDPLGGNVWNTNGEALYAAALEALLIGDFVWVVNIQPNTYLYVAQKSPTEKQTTVSFGAIGYDKYTYTLAVNAYRNESMVAGRPTPYPTASDVGNATGIFLLINDNAAQGTTGLYQSNGSSVPPTNITKSYLTKYVRVVGPGVTRDSTGTIQATTNGGLTEAAQVAAYTGQIVYINSAGGVSIAAAGQAVLPKLNNNFNTVSFSITEPVYPGSTTSGGTFTGSLDPSGVDGYGASIYWPNVLPDDAFSFVTVAVIRAFNNELDGNGFYTGYRLTDQFGYGAAQYIDILRGQRYVTNVVEGLVAAGTVGSIPAEEFTSVLLDGWVEAAKSTYDPSTLFMEPSGIESLKDQMFALRSASQKMSTFISPKLITASEAADVASIVVNDRTTGFSQYLNQFLRADSYTGKKWWSNLVGVIGTNLSAIMANKMGGWAPMYTNAGGLGGQLAVTVIKALYNFTSDDQKLLDTMGLNAIVLDPSYGVMIVSQKTTQDPDNISDWSYLGHSMAFDLFKREIRDGVMTPQIGKPNDTYYQGMRQRQAEAILARRTGGTNPIWASGKVEIANVNTDSVKAARDFAIRITVKVNIFSETVTLTFVNVAQTTSIS